MGWIKKLTDIYTSFCILESYLELEQDQTERKTKLGSDWSRKEVGKKKKKKGSWHKEGE